MLITLLRLRETDRSVLVGRERAVRSWSTSHSQFVTEALLRYVLPTMRWYLRGFFPIETTQNHFI